MIPFFCFNPSDVLVIKKMLHDCEGNKQKRRISRFSFFVLCISHFSKSIL